MDRRTQAVIQSEAFDSRYGLPNSIEHAVDVTYGDDNFNFKVIAAFMTSAITMTISASPTVLVELTELISRFNHENPNFNFLCETSLDGNLCMKGKQGEATERFLNLLENYLLKNMIDPANMTDSAKSEDELRFTFNTLRSGLGLNTKPIVLSLGALCQKVLSTNAYKSNNLFAAAAPVSRQVASVDSNQQPDLRVLCAEAAEARLAATSKK